MPTGNWSPVQAPLKQDPPEALGLADVEVHCFLPELGQPEQPDVGLHPIHTGAICSSTMTPTPAACSALPFSPCTACSSHTLSRDKPGTLKTYCKTNLSAINKWEKAFVHFLLVYSPAPAEDVCLLSLLKELQLTGIMVGAWCWWDERASPRQALMGKSGTCVKEGHLAYTL